MLLCGDWRQILPVVRHESRAQIVEATLKISYLWSQVIPLQMIINIRAAQAGKNSETTESATFLEEIRNGTVPILKDLDEFTIRIPPAYFVEGSHLKNLCHFVFDYLSVNYRKMEWLASRVIITSNKKFVDKVNDFVM